MALVLGIAFALSPMTAWMFAIFLGRDMALAGATGAGFAAAFQGSPAYVRFGWKSDIER